MLNRLIILFKFFSCSTSQGDEINFCSNKKTKTDISVNDVKSFPMHPTKELGDFSDVYEQLESSKMFSSTQSHTCQNNYSSVEYLNKTSDVLLFQGKNEEKSTYCHKKFKILCDIPQTGLKLEDLITLNISQSSSYLNDTASILKEPPEKSNGNYDFNPNIEENNRIHNSSSFTTSNTNETQTHNVYSILENKPFSYSDHNLELGNKGFHNSEPNFSLKRKNIDLEAKISEEPLNLSVKTAPETNSLEPKTKKMCTHKESSNLKNYGQKEKREFNYTILLKYSNFISKIECLLKEFLMQNKSVETYINKLIYNCDLLILPEFSSDIFGEWEIGCTEALRRVSTTAEMLSKFIDFCNNETENKLVSSLKDCLNKRNYTSWTDENIYDFILNEITIFLKSKESLYVKSICTEFYSFVDLYEDLAIKTDVSLVNAFAVFLLLVKRNSIIIYQLKETLRASKFNKKKDLIIDREIQNSSALLFVFLDNLNFSSTNYIRTNMRTSIVYKCISDQLSSIRKHFFQVQVVALLSNLFFYFIKYNINYHPNEVLKLKESLKKLHITSPDRLIEIKKIRKHINNFQLNIYAKALEQILMMKIGPRFKTHLLKILKIISETKSFKLNIGIFNLALRLAYTIFHFQDCKMGYTINFLARHFYRLKIKTNPS